MVTVKIYNGDYVVYSKQYDTQAEAEAVVKNYDGGGIYRAVIEEDEK